MENSDHLQDSEIETIIIEQLEELGLEPGSVRVKIAPGPKIFLEGEVTSERMREIIRRAIIESTGVSDLVDEMIVVHDDDRTDDNDEEDVYDDDNVVAGTEDVFKSIEDGVPYIPPDHPSLHEDEPDQKKWKKKKGKRE